MNMDKNEKDYLNSLCETFRKEIELRKTIQQEGNKPPGSQALSVIHATLNVSENCKNHHTDKYEQCIVEPQRLVVRRGFPFLVSLHCDRPYDANSDLVLIELTFGTRKILKLQPSEVKSDKADWQWGATLKKAFGVDIHIEIRTKSTCPVGEWKMKIQTGTVDKARTLNAYTSYICPDFIFILFNPWCRDDEVFMEDDEEREEYVLNDSGSLWQGAKRSQYEPCKWNFGQFEDASLYAALTVLRMNDLTDIDRKDPILTVRKMTESVNKFLVAGKWDEPFDDGTKPWEWTGSVEIMEKFMANPHVKVRYAQCWVFSGVLVTLCRALGIPCRSVTNISSAHDTDKTLTIDDIYIKKAEGRNFKKHSNDSVWNFHVWNEVYMKRADLPPGFDGWQVCDSTPQERSQGRYQCGPMSVVALRTAQVKLDYDGWFIYGEVNADVVSWYYEEDPNAPNGLKMVKVDTDTKQVGRCILTSDIRDSSTPLEVTLFYKPKEGSDEERQQFRNAIRTVVGTDRTEIMKLYNCDKKTEDDVSFKMNDIEVVPFGKTVSSLLNVSNESLFTRTIIVTMEMYVVRYDGVKQDMVSEYEEELVLEENRVAKIKLECNVSYYGEKLKEHFNMCVDVIAHVKETGQIYSNRDSFLIEKQKLEISGSRRAKVNVPTSLTFVFKNPCNHVLNNCHLKVEGIGLGKIFKAEIAKQVKAREELKIVYTVVPKRSGKKSLVAILSADELSNIRGFYSLQVD